MEPMKIAGLALIGTGLLDVVLAFLVIGPRLRDPRGRAVVQLALSAGGALLVAVGVLMYTGRLGAIFGPS